MVGTVGASRKLCAIWPAAVETSFDKFLNVEID
jgi:hypothetical protein